MRQNMYNIEADRKFDVVSVMNLESPFPIPPSLSASVYSIYPLLQTARLRI